MYSDFQGICTECFALTDDRSKVSGKMELQAGLIVPGSCPSTAFRLGRPASYGDLSTRTSCWDLRRSDPVLGEDTGTNKSPRERELLLRLCPRSSIGRSDILSSGITVFRRRGEAFFATVFEMGLR